MKSNLCILGRSLLAGFSLLADASGGTTVAREPIHLAHGVAPDMSQTSGRNPLAAVPLDELTATRERPIFSPSRRAPSLALDLASPFAPPQPAKPPEPERPELSLVGTISGYTGGFGIFLDRSTNIMLRLKEGEAHKGWTLSAVRGRETVLEKAGKTTTLALPVPSLTDDKN